MSDAFVITMWWILIIAILAAILFLPGWLRKDER